MAFDIRNSIGFVAGYLSGSGHLSGGVAIGEPKAPPADISAAVFMNNVQLIQFYLNGGTQELHVVQVRLYHNMLADLENVEYRLAKAASDITSDLLGDFDLGGEIRSIDGAGEHGQALTATWGYVDVGGTMYRVVDMQLPLVVDDSATAAA